MLGLKRGVKIEGIKPECILGIISVNAYFEKHNVDFWITSVKDGKHGENSLHYGGYAFDVRIRNLDGVDGSFSSEDIVLANVYAKELAELLGGLFDVVVESDHIHVEYDPK